MRTKKRSLLTDVPSWILAILILVIITIVLFVADELVHSFDPGGKTAVVLFFLLVSAACFIIVRQNPESIWYVPVICNVMYIFSAIFEPHFWKGVDWIFVCSVAFNPFPCSQSSVNKNSVSGVYSRFFALYLIRVHITKMKHPARMWRNLKSGLLLPMNHGGG